MFRRCLAAAALALSCVNNAGANLDPMVQFEMRKYEFGPRIKMSLRYMQGPHSKTMQTFLTIYCSRWNEMKILIDLESQGKDSVDAFEEQDSCYRDQVTVMPEQVLMKFTFHNGIKTCAVRALDSDLMSTVYVFLHPPTSLRKKLPKHEKYATPVAQETRRLAICK